MTTGPPSPPASAGPKTGTIVVLVILGLFVFSQLTKNYESSSSYSSPTTRARDHTVIYRVTGTATSASLTLENDTGGVDQLTVRLPWERSYSGFSSGDFVYISAQNQGSAGGVTCEILVGGRVVYSSRSSGAYVICDASGTA